MIDIHVHCRDEEQSKKETIAHALYVAEQAGLSGIFDMPNTARPVTTYERAQERLAIAEKANSPVVYGTYIGLTADTDQVRKAVDAHAKLFPRVVGFKMYAGHSVGNLGVTDPNHNPKVSEAMQRGVYETLAQAGYRGVLAVHCENEHCIDRKLFDPTKPATHSTAQPYDAEVTSVRDQLRFAREANFKGTLHVVHTSTAKAVELVDDARNKSPYKVSCGVTPHHLLLHTGELNNMQHGLWGKVNPPLRKGWQAEELRDLFLKGKIDVVETDHAPHLHAEKVGGNYMSGFPGLPFWPYTIMWMESKGFSQERIPQVTHENVEKIFNLQIPLLKREPRLDLHTEYEVDVYAKLREKILAMKTVA